MTEFFLLGGALFWVLFGLLNIVLFFGSDRTGWVYTVTVVFGALFGYQLWPLFNWKMALVGLIFYFVIGAIWSVMKWFMYVKETVRNADIPKQDKNDNRGRAIRGIKQDIDASYNKDKITAWIVFWPWNLVYTFTHDLIDNIFNALANVYKGITERALKNAGLKEDETI
jgi:hypothetical protein